jgi:soluble lytic murein transglycosylase-like protein
MAYAVPRNAPSPDVEIILPQPLPPSAVAQVQRILSLQAQGDFSEADRLIARLDDTTLVGPILADRYLSPNYRSSSDELLDWYEQYNDQPEAGDIYQLLLKKLPSHVVPPLAPVIALLPEPTVTATGAARPSSSPDNPAWRSLFLTAIDDWKRGDIDDAGPIFMRTAEMAGISDADRAAGQFWAARAALRLQQPQAYLDWLHEAAAAPNTFYGILAGRLLGEGLGPTGIAATLTEADITAVDATPDGHLAFALLQVGETDEAATALRALWPDMQNDPDLGRAVMAVAARAGLVDVAIAVSTAVASPDEEIAGARLPMPALHPAGGFTIDPALVYALARTESGFDARAVSPAGARGLMQLMPQTARYIRRAQGISGVLSDPSANLALGQAYIRYLGDQTGISDNLLAILASYNAGPGAAAAWCGALAEDSDPLIFIETIPNAQTRHFVHQVLADSWLYAEEIGIRPASLDDLAEGNFPTLSLNFATASSN